MATVLIVEDDPANILVFSKILKKRAQLDVIHTEDAEEVVQLAESGQVDLVLMDVSLAHTSYKGKPMDGIAITQMLKANEKTAHLPVILVTAHAMRGDRESFLAQSGADSYISKPVVDQQAFVDQIQSLMTPA
jgi:two-component system, cell cycle response regulator DivK